MRKPMMLLISIALSIMMLSFIFPADPTKPDILSWIKFKNSDKAPKAESISNNYQIININRLVSSGDALAWSLDEKYLYYSVEAQGDDETGAQELWMCDMNGDKKRIAEDAKLYNISKARFSPDGTMLSFVSSYDDIASLMIYNVSDGSLKDITPKKAGDSGVTSYDWDDDSSSIIMSVGISNPKVNIYNFKTGKTVGLDINLTSCRNVAYYGENMIIYSDIEDNRYKIFSADRHGRNPSFITEGWEFKISPDRHKLAIISDGDGQRGLWIYYTGFNKRNALSSSIIYDAYWMKDSSSLMYSIQEDSRNNYTYKGNIYYYGKDEKTINITGAAYTIFLPSSSGNKIIMTSPQYLISKKEDMGIFLGDLYKQP